MTNFYFVRHGETLMNHQGRFNGGNVDSALTASGKAAAVHLGQALSETFFDCALTSPLQRARTTAKLIMAENRKTPSTTLQIEPDLRELDLGDWDGQLVVEQKQHSEFDHYFHQPELFDATQIHGESYQNLLRRGLQVINQGQKVFPNGNVLIVSHGIMLLFVLNTLLDVSFEQIRD